MSDDEQNIPLVAALDPTRSAVVEACAGSGKPWLLVSRMLRLLPAVDATDFLVQRGLCAMPGRRQG